MTEQISQFFASLIGIAFLSAIAESFVKRPKFRQILRMITMICLSTMLLSVFLKLSYLDYASALRSLQIDSAWDAESAQTQDRELKRRIIEAELRAYIESKAEAYGVPVRNVEVFLVWDTRGLWVPERAVITVSSKDGDTDALRDVIEADLGIGSDMQDWRLQERG